MVTVVASQFEYVVGLLAKQVCMELEISSTCTPPKGAGYHADCETLHVCTSLMQCAWTPELHGLILYCTEHVQIRVTGGEHV